MKPLRRRAHRAPIALEALEDRLLMAGDLLITSQVPGAEGYHLMQYTQQGALVSAQSIGEGRGLTVDPSGNINIYEGTFTPALATLSATTHNWSYQSMPGWSTVASVSYGEVAAYKDSVFASDMFTYNGGEPNGIIRFSDSGAPPVRFAQGTGPYDDYQHDFIQVSLGLDGQLYGLDYFGGVHVYNPDTLAAVKTLSLTGGPDTDIRSIAVDASGQIFAATWGGYVAKYDSSGHHESSIQLKGQFGGGENLINIALDKDGQIAVGGRFGEIYLTNESLASPTTIRTGQWNVFVTFDHYIGTAPQIVTPFFDSLAGPTITYGQPSVTLGGRITAGTSIPTGSVDITLNGVTKSAAINPADGTFAANFDTSTLGVANSPYQITYSYAGDKNDAAIKDTSKSLTVNQAQTTLNNLSSPTIVVGTPTVTLSGAVGSNSVLPVNQSVSVTISGANGPVASGTGTIGKDGSFSVTLDTSALPVGSYSIAYSYAGDSNFTGSQGKGTLNVTYAINTLFDTTKPVQPGAALPVKLQVTDAQGNDLSSADLTVTAVSIVDANGNTITPQAKGNSNPDNVFRKVGFGYLYNLDTAGLTPGKYSLLVRVGNDPVLHAISFVIG
jgi:hypothetical protein